MCEILRGRGRSWRAAAAAAERRAWRPPATSHVSDIRSLELLGCLPNPCARFTILLQLVRVENRCRNYKIRLHGLVTLKKPLFKERQPQERVDYF